MQHKNNHITLILTALLMLLNTGTVLSDPGSDDYNVFWKMDNSSSGEGGELMQLAANTNKSRASDDSRRNRRSRSSRNAGSNSSRRNRAADVTDYHGDGSITTNPDGSDWTVESGTASHLTETGGLLKLSGSNGDAVQLINDYSCANDGTFEADFSFEWNPERMGIMFRWTSSSSYYFAYIKEKNSIGDTIKVAENTTSTTSGTVVTTSAGLSQSTTYSLKIVLNGSSFDFYIDDSYVGNFTDASNTTGQFGYGCPSGGWNGGMEFAEVTWTDGDSDPPTVYTYSPLDDAAGVGINDNLVLTFDEAVDAEAGAPNDIVIYNSNDTEFERIDAQDGKITGSGTATITINPAGTFVASSSYYVKIEANAFDDAFGNSYAGISDETTWNFSTSDHNKWGIVTDTFALAANHTNIRTMGGTSPNTDNMWVTKLFYYSSGSGTVSMALYTGDNINDPTSGETRLTYAANQSVVAGWNEIDVTDVAWPKQTITWIGWAKGTGADVEYTAVAASSEDFEGTNGRWAVTTPADADETSALPTSIGAGSFSTYWYAVHAGYIISDNVAPTDISLSSQSVNEKLSSGTVVGTFTTTDANSGDNHTYTEATGTGDTDNDKFQISGSTLQTSQEFIYEDGHTYSVRIRTTDDGYGSLTYEEAFTITINNTVMGDGTSSGSMDLAFTGGWELGGKDADTEQLSSSKYLDGHLDEIRVVDALRIADWIKLCYETQKIDQTCVTFVIGDDISLLPLTVVNNIGEGSTDTVMIYCDNWTIVFREGAGGGIEWLSDETNHGGTNQMTTNMFYINANGSNGYSATNTLSIVESNTIFCKVKQEQTIDSHNWTTIYTVYGTGKMFVRTETEAITAGYGPVALQFNVAKDITTGAYNKENATASLTNYLLLSDTDTDKYDILLTLNEDWGEADGFVGGTADYYGIQDAAFSLSAGSKKCWDFMVDFGHMQWDDATNVGSYADDFRGPDSLEFLAGHIGMERAWEHGLVGHWPLDEASSGSANGATAYDFSGASSPHNGTLSSNTCTWTDGKWNGGLLFDGNDYVTVSHNTNFTSGVFTLMMWIKPSSAITASSVLLGKYASGTSTGYKLTGDGDNYLALTLDGTTISASSGPGTDTVHVAASYHIHSGMLKLYINGQPVKYVVNQYALTANTEDVVIGNGFSGVIDDVRFYNTEISEETIKAIYQNGFRSNEGMYMLRASNNNTVHFRIDGSGSAPVYYPILRIENYWSTSKPTKVYYDGSWLTENTDYLAKLEDAANVLYLGFDNKVTTSDLRIYIDDTDGDGALMVEPMDSMTYEVVARGGYSVKNTNSASFGAAGSNEFYLYWKMDNGATGMGGELYEFKSSNISSNTSISSAANILQTTTANGAFGFFDHHNTDYGSSCEDVDATPTYTVLEASGTRVRLRIDERTVDGSNLDYDINTIWTIYPTGQIFRYDSIDAMSALFDYEFVRFRTKAEGSLYVDSSDDDYRGILYGGGSTVHDHVVALTGSGNKNGSTQLFTGYNDVDFQYSAGNYMGFKFDGSDNRAVADAPFLYAFYYDIQHNNMVATTMDSVGESVQDIDFDNDDMTTGTRVTTSEGDINGDGFNEGEGAYVVQASNNSVDFTIQADAGTDGCRFYPAIRVTNYYANNKPKYVYLHSGASETKLLEGYGYNCYHNKTDDYIVIQLDTVLCADADVYIAADDDLAVTMSEFYAKAGDGKDTLFWRTESEKDNLGFNLYRRINPVFMDSLVRAIDSAISDTGINTAGRMLKQNKIGYADTAWVKVNPTIIPGVKGGTSVGPRDYRKIDYEVDNHILYEYNLEAISFDKNRDVYGPVAVRPIPIFPKKFCLFHNFPNPVIRYTNIRFDVPRESKVSLYIYNLQGRLIRRLIRPDRKMKPGFYRVLWRCDNDQGRKIAAGPYIYRLHAGKKFAKSRLMIVVK